MFTIGGASLIKHHTALEIEIKFAAWAESIMSKLNPEQTQQMLNTEFGGMNEVLADLYADTGDRRWLNLSRRRPQEGTKSTNGSR